MPRTLPDRSDLAGAEEWIRSLVTPTGPVEVAHRRRVGAFAQAIAWVRQRDALPADARPSFDRAFRIVLGRAVASIASPSPGR